MAKLQDLVEKPIKAFLVGIEDDRTGSEAASSLMAEMRGLAETLGLDIIHSEEARCRSWGAKYGLGSGKAEELCTKALEMGAQCLIFDRDISPSQQRNWEDLAGGALSVVDRQELIIQIFSSRAHTREAELQAELARLSWSLPRLTHKYIDLARQRGGHYGTRGSGETKLESDRRLVMGRIGALKKELEEVRSQRSVQRSRRKRQAVPVCALVGYTNAGKSSLLNALTGADSYVEDKLFATLDPTARKLFLEEMRSEVILVDTVGFIRNLPHLLVEAFHATLEEAAFATLLIHVLDVSDPQVMDYYDTTVKVLQELGADSLPRITVLNKVDRVEKKTASLLVEKWGGLPVSAKNGEGLPELKRRIARSLSTSPR